MYASRSSRECHLPSQQALISRFMRLSGEKGCFPLMVSLAKT